MSTTTATEAEVRGIVEALDTYLQRADIDDDLRGSVTLAVAEALNNIVEHAYTRSVPGAIDVTADLLPEVIRMTLRDHGRPLPGGTVPPANLPDSTGTLDSLPEGGFGWFLIHKLSDHLAYDRKPGQNTLRLSFSRNPPAR